MHTHTHTQTLTRRMALSVPSQGCSLCGPSVLPQPWLPKAVSAEGLGLLLLSVYVLMNRNDRDVDLQGLGPSFWSRFSLACSSHVGQLQARNSEQRRVIQKQSQCTKPWLTPHVSQGHFLPKSEFRCWNRSSIKQWTAGTYLKHTN